MGQVVMDMERCPACGYKRWNPLSQKCYGCKVEKTRDGRLVEVPAGWVMDPNGNIYRFEYVKEGNLLIEKKTYRLEAGATTLRGDYPKLAEPPKCLYPSRLCCNHGPAFDRCEFMEPGARRGDGGVEWACAAKAKGSPPPTSAPPADPKGGD